MRENENPGPIIGYKGFDSDMQCLNYQYKVGEVHKTDGYIELCDCGFHFCLNPLDVFNYYPPSEDGELARYARVEARGVSKESGDDSKKVARELLVLAELSLKDMVDASIEFIAANAAATTDGEVAYTVLAGEDSETVVRHCGHRSCAVVTENNSMAVAENTGSVAAALSETSVAITKGSHGVAVASGIQSVAKCDSSNSIAANVYSYGVAMVSHSSAAVASSSYGIAESCGPHSVTVATGTAGTAISRKISSLAVSTAFRGSSITEDQVSDAISTGLEGRAEATGTVSCAYASGIRGRAKVTQEGSVAVAVGEDGYAAGAVGSWLVLTEWKYLCEEGSRKERLRKEVRSVFVDGDTVKADTYYTLENGELVMFEGEP